MEAYIGEADRASHARFGPTDRNRVMYGPPGIAYVYLVYGMYDCLNIVTEPAGRPAALLVRAVEPVAGVAAMRAARLATALRRRRGVDPTAEAARLDRSAERALTAGPGLVAGAFGLDRSWTGTDLCDPDAPLRLESAPPGEAPGRIVAGPRIGVDYAGEPWTSRPWRFVLARGD